MGFWANLTPFLPWQSIVMIVDRPARPASSEVATAAEPFQLCTALHNHFLRYSL